MKFIESKAVIEARKAAEFAAGYQKAMNDCGLDKEIVRARCCIALLSQTLPDIMPQIGKLVLQDYAKLNEGLILAEKILHDDEHAD